MLNDALPTYLQDHLAGALHAIELLKAIWDHFSGEPLGTFVAEIVAEVEADREVLARLTERTGGTAGGVKEWGPWLAEKVSRIKLKHGSPGGLGTFEALDFLVIGVHGKRAPGRVLAAVAPFDAQLQGVDFSELAVRAENQHQKIEERRLACGHSVFRHSLISLQDIWTQSSSLGRFLPTFGESSASQSRYSDLGSGRC